MAFGDRKSGAIMSKSKKRLLVFADNKYHDGHEADFRHALTRALDKISYLVFEEIPKTPEGVFSAMISGILFSDAVLVDGTPYANVISPNSLIQYGICYALDKKCMFVAIKNNSREVLFEIKCKIVDGYVEFDYYLDFLTQFKNNFLEWVDTQKNDSRVKSNTLAVHSFIAFGIERWKTPDLFEIVSNFSLEKGWTPRVVSNIGSLSKLESLAKAVSQRSFCVFCLDKNDSEEIFLGIGLAIGMGRPFLIVKHKSVELPISLRGYRGIIEFDSYFQLKDELSKYEGKFLSDEVFEWEGTTYNDLLSKFEKQIGSIPSNKFNEFESVLLTVNSVLGDTAAKPYALLGELYREKNRKIAPDNVELLIMAKEYYEKALNVQKDYQLYQNAVAAIDKHIQLIELIKEKKYRSIPSLVNLIGGEIKADHYSQVKVYLLDVVSKLVGEKNYAHAISLLAAMQVHDKSEQIQKLIQQILNLAPLEIITALQDSQKLIAELESDKMQMVDRVKEKDLQLDKMTKEINFSSEQLLIEKENLEHVKIERDKLSSELKGISDQLSMFHDVMTNLESEIELAKNMTGRGVIVNFGKGWGIYRAIDGEPYVIRDRDKLLAQKGLELYSGDIVYDGDDVQIVEYLPNGAIVVRPDNDHYADVNTLLYNDE